MAADTSHISLNDEINKVQEALSKDKKSVAAKKRVAAVPHYLRASTGSCHDSCKFGKPHVFNEKPWRAVRRTSAPLPEKAKTVGIQIFVGRKVKKTVRVDNHLEHRPSDEAPATNATLKKSYLLSTKITACESSKSVELEARPFMKSPSQPSKVTIKAVQSPGRSTSKVMKKAVQSPGRSSSPDISKLIKQEEGASPSKNDVLLKSTPSKPVVRGVSAIKPSRLAVKSSLSPDVFKPLRGKQVTETKFTDHPRSSSVVVRKNLTPSATKLSVKRSPKLDTKNPLNPSEDMIAVGSTRLKDVKSNNVRKTNGISPKDQIPRYQPSENRAMVNKNKTEVKRTNNETAEEKTLLTIETTVDHLPKAPISSHFMQSPSPLSPESLDSSSQANSVSFSSHEVDSDIDDSISNYMDHEKSNGRRNSRLDQDPSAFKLKFRKGKVVELESEIDSARRLRFKQGGILRDDQVATSGSNRKSFKKDVVKIEQKGDTEQEKVALKHQEMVTKDEQVLYNNVIEETAIKLVQNRKSKVKALVGAFETVISLQERKPAAANK
ncbi:hypothetical protein vseg_000830 [Gypsophila vaccaria]